MPNSTKQNIKYTPVSEQEFTRFISELNDDYGRIVKKLERLGFSHSIESVNRAHRSFVSEVFNHIKTLH